MRCGANFFARKINCFSRVTKYNLHLRHMSKRLTEIDKEFRREAASKFREVVDTQFNGNETAAARALGLHRQRFKLYLQEKFTPSADVLGLACELWGIEIVVGNIKLRSQQLRKRKAFVSRKMPVQLALDLFNKPQELSSENVFATVSRKTSKTLSLVLDITLTKNAH